MADSRTDSFLQSVKNSHFIKAVLLAGVILLLQVPITKIRGVISEREQTRAEALEEVTVKWGKSQSVIGPTIIVPYVNRSLRANYRTGQPEYAVFLPEELKISGSVASRLRYRGIFEVPVYGMSLVLTGRFSRPDFSEWSIDSNDVLWDRAYLCVQATDARRMTKSPVLSWNNESLECLPDAGELGGHQQGLHVRLEDHLEGESFDFSLSLDLNGSVGAFFAPLGRDTEVELTSDWPSPSFQGAWLPTERAVNSEGFEATWNIPYLSRNYPQNWRSGSDLEQAVASSLFGVNMISCVDDYRMSQRSVKYQFLFLVLTFATLWLFEVLIKVRIHPMQYLLIGSGMCLFYLLELSLAEHLGFVSAYAVASAAVVALITFYSAAVLKTSKRALIVGGVVTLLYIYLYVLLMIQDYALLTGSIGLFVALAVIMFLTRRLDWYSLTDGVVITSILKGKNHQSPGNPPEGEA